MNDEIKELQERIINIAKRHSVKRLALFGSIVRGEMKANSDIDILVVFEGDKSLLDLIGLEIDLKDELERNVGVFTYNSIHPLLRDSILSEQEVIL